MRGTQGRRGARLPWLAAGAVALAAGGGAALQVSVPAGAWVWETMDEVPPPLEFPAGSGAHLASGTLEVRPASAEDARSGRFALGFELRGTDGATAPSGIEGWYVSFADSLHFVPDGSSPAEPVRFRYAWLPDGRVALTDSNGHVWVYRRQS